MLRLSLRSRALLGSCTLVFSTTAALAVVACETNESGTGSVTSSSGSVGQGGSGDGGAGAGAGTGAGADGGGGGSGGEILSTAPRGAEATAALCSNGVDDDGNGYADCDDSWCRQTVELTLCDALENTAAKCADGVDNVESPRIPAQTSLDGHIDCADPDCSKSLALSLCPARAFEIDSAACSNGSDDDGDGLTDCADLDCLHAGVSSCPLGGRRRVLFDDAHRQRAGNADWVVDMPGRHPWPTAPASELEWAGLLSSFGKDLVDGGGYTVEILPSATGRMTFKSPDNPQDLSQYSVVVVPEPSAPFDPEESAALLAFIQAGGGVLMVTDHFDSDRDGNGWDSVQVWNDFFARAGGGQVEKSPFGFSVTELSYEDSGAIEGKNGGSTEVLGDAAHPVVDGAHGKVSRLGMHRGGLFTLYPGQNPTVAVLFHALPANSPGYEAGSPYVVAAEVGAGRVVAVGDSAITGDGTNSHGLDNPSFDSYHQPGEQNAALLRNAVEWLAGP